MVHEHPQIGFLSGPSAMSLSRFTLWMVVAAIVLTVAAASADAFPSIGAKPHRSNNKGKQGGPLDAAIKDLKQADKDLEAKKSSEASQLTHAAGQIVSQASKQANGQGGDKDKGKSLDAVWKGHPRGRKANWQSQVRRRFDRDQVGDHWSRGADRGEEEVMAQM